MVNSLALASSQYVVKEHVALIKLTDTFDIFDAATQKKVAVARETPNGFIKFLRLLIDKLLLPNIVTVTENDENGPVVFTIQKPFTWFRSVVRVLDANGTELGHFKSKLISFGGGFLVFDPKGGQVAEVKGDWKGWNFKFTNATGQEFGSVSKQWAGVAKELFTSADTYGVTIAEAAGSSQEMRALLLAAALAVDVVYKEGKG